MNKANRKLSAGDWISGRFSIVRPIGQGGMAYVYLAIDQTTNQQVAIKVMKDDLSNDQEFIKRFDTEAKAASSLDHPNIIKVLGYGQDGDLRYIVQEYVEGMTLKDLIREYGALDYQVAVPLAIQIGLALEHAHHRGVVHRDIKPQNILITRDRIAKVTDFGIARASNANTITLTSGVAYGSVHYFSPEQARGSLVGEQSDIYSLGILMYEMLTGKMPFDGETSVSVAIKHLQELPPVPSQLVPSIPVGLDQIVMKCIQKSTEKRYVDARELVDELDTFLIEPDGIYGVISGQAEWEGNTTAIGLQSHESNFGKLREVEKAISERRRLRTRDTAIMVAIIVISVAILITIFSLSWQKVSSSLTTKTAAEYQIANYIGQSYNDVSNSLDAVGVKYTVRYVSDPSVKEGFVIDQTPGEGVSIRPGSTIITLYVSGGQNLVTIPDYSNRTAAEAKAELEQMYGFKVDISYEYSDIIKENVIKTVPAAGQSVASGSAVTLVVSDGTPMVTMPTLIGMNLSTAQAEIVKNNLVNGPTTNINPIIDPATGQPVGFPLDQLFVISQSVGPGESIIAQSVIGITNGTQSDYVFHVGSYPPGYVPTETAPTIAAAPVA
ncbi:MAG: kinase domain protein [Firmicutes bacterium]|nr:kinase domain protein [Bacillota bacterium]